MNFHFVGLSRFFASTGDTMKFLSNQSDFKRLALHRVSYMWRNLGKPIWKGKGGENWSKIRLFNSKIFWCMAYQSREMKKYGFEKIAYVLKFENILSLFAMYVFRVFSLFNFFVFFFSCYTNALYWLNKSV